MGTVIGVNFQAGKRVPLHDALTPTQPDGHMAADIKFYKRNDATRMGVLEALAHSKEIATTSLIPDENPEMLCRLTELKGASLEDLCIVLNTSSAEVKKSYAPYFRAVSLAFFRKLERVKLFMSLCKSPV